jgi:predicted RNA-binding protein (virulence factor B family)
MIVIGEFNTLKVIRQADQGMYLGEIPEETVLLPNRYIPKGLDIDDTIEVFVYGDSENRPIATTLRPKVTLNQFGVLKVLSVGNYGAFMDWGIAKDLLVPFSEQKHRLEVGENHVVYLYMDAESDRLTGSTHIGKHLMTAIVTVKEGQEVDLMVYEISEIGVSVIINQVHKGLIFNEDIFQPIEIGDQMKGYIKRIREDQKIDVSLQPFGYSKVEPNAQIILDYIKKRKGFINITDKTDPDTIYKELKMSKKLFKKSIGALYKQKLIRLEEDGIYLV